MVTYIPLLYVDIKVVLRDILEHDGDDDLGLCLIPVIPTT